jgi:hypothetical protein
MNLPIDIVLNVYLLGDATNPNFQRLQMLSNLGLGVYHTGIEIEGIEYSYGGNRDNSGTGVFRSSPGNVPGATYL